MNLEETTAVLAKAAAFDQRTIGEADVLAWHEVIGDLALPAALDSVTRHYREETRRIMPADVRRLVGKLAAVERAKFLAGIEALPACDHGYTGGHVPDASGWTACPFNRRATGYELPSVPRGWWDN